MGGAGSSMEKFLLEPPWPVSKAAPPPSCAHSDAGKHPSPPSLLWSLLCAKACCGTGDISMSKHQWGSPRGAQNSAGKTDVATMKSGL